MIKQWLRNYLGIQELSNSVEVLKKRSSFIDRLKKEIAKRNREVKKEIPESVVKGYNGSKNGL